jgi:hypothetical protein
VEPHGGPATVPGDRRFWPNPAELPEALERLPHHAGFRQPSPVIAVDLAGSKRARQPPSSHPARQERGRHAHPVRHCCVQPPRMGTPPRYSVRYGGIDAFNARMTAEKERLSLSAVRRQLEGPIAGSSTSSGARPKVSSAARRASPLPTARHVRPLPAARRGDTAMATKEDGRPSSAFRCLELSKSAETQTSGVASAIQSGPPQPIVGARPPPLRGGRRAWPAR